MKITSTLLLACSGAQAFTSVSKNMRLDTAVASSPYPDQSWFFQHNGSIQQEDHYAPDTSPDNWMYNAWGTIRQDDFAYKPTGEDDWCYQPWSGIGQTDFFPVSHYYQEMMSKPSPAKPTAPRMPQQSAPPAPQQTMPQQNMPQFQTAGAQASA